MNRMLIDTTTIQTMKIILLAPIREIIEHGKIHGTGGRRVSGLAIEGRSFSKFELEALQYMLWNTFGIAPPDNVKDVISILKEKVAEMVPDKTPLATLCKLTVDIPPNYESLGLSPPPETPVKPKKVSTAKPAGTRPKPGTQTGIVWDVCDELTAALNREPTRKEVVEKCEYEGVNPATASTQFGKWKKRI